VRVSAFELSTIYATAFKMFGMPAGMANDAASIVAAAGLCGLAGLETTQRFLERHEGASLEPEFVVQTTGSTVSISAGGASLLTAGAAALDLACTETDGCAVIISDLTDTVLAPGLARLVRARGVEAFIEWRCANELHSLSVLDEVETARTPVKPPDCLLAETQMRVNLRAHARKARETSLCFRNAAFTSVNQLEAQAVRDGAEVESDGWAQVVALADTMLVPENEQSRSGGAGIGADGD